MVDPRDGLVIQLVARIIRAIAHYPELVVINAEATEDGAVSRPRVHPADAQRVIGRHGSNVGSILTFVAAVGWKQKRHYSLEIRGDQGQAREQERVDG